MKLGRGHYLSKCETWSLRSPENVQEHLFASVINLRGAQSSAISLICDCNQFDLCVSWRM